MGFSGMKFRCQYQCGLVVFVWVWDVVIVLMVLGIVMVLMALLL